jgi:hypothetical protein
MLYSKNYNPNIMWKRIKYSLLSIIQNKDINILLISLILNIFYLITENFIPIAIQILFIASLSKDLMNVLKAVVTKINKWLIVLGFSWLVIVLFSWIAMIWFSSLFTYEVYDINTVNNNLKIFSEKLYLKIIVIHLGNASYL